LHRATWELLGETKVSEYNVTIGGDKDILWLEVTINDTSSMQALYTLDNFGSIESCTITPKTTPPC
jgi:hypothetical protein